MRLTRGHVPRTVIPGPTLDKAPQSADSGRYGAIGRPVTLGARMRINHLGAAAATATLAVTAALAAPASATHSWGNYHWARQSNPFTLQVGDNVSAAWDGYLDTSIGQWSSSRVLDLAETTGGTTGKQCKATRGRVEVCNASYGRNGWLGLASISITGGSHITAGTVKVNDTYFAMARYNNPDERAHVMCQEIGHTFGLGHTSEDGSSQQTCMDYSEDPASTDPNAHDYAQLESIYAHLDSTTTVGSSSSVAPRTAGSNRASWGREVHRSKDHHHSTFIREYGNGETVVTEVTWAH